MGFTPESFSESELKTVVIFVDPPNNDKITIQEQNGDENAPMPKPAPTSPFELPTSFITGNNYALNSNHILISSNDGIELNNLLIEQIDEWEKDAEHTENFWSRTDQVIMGNFGVANALQNPFTENNYHIDGTKYSENTRSNLEYFVKERGYDLDNFENIPNHMLSPKKYDLSRTVSKQIQNPLSNNLDIQHVRDLRDIAPNSFDFTPEEQMQMFRQSIKSTSFDVVGSLMPKLIVDESMFLPESEIPNTNNEQSLNKQNPLESLNSNSEQNQKQKLQEKEEVFQQTSHIKDLINNSDFKPNYILKDEQKFPYFEIISSLMMSIGTVVLWHIIKKYYKQNPETSLSVIPEKITHDYLNDVELLLEQANLLYKKSYTKDAYEKLSQSMRVFYSNKLGLDKEIITSDLLSHMKNFNKSEKSLVKNSLHLSTMIEFAKHSENNKQFIRIMHEFSQIIRKEKI